MAKTKPTQSNPPTKGPTGKAGSGLDLSSFRAPAAPSGAPAKTSRARDAATSSQQAEREQRPRVSWEDLAGVEGLSVLDVWTDENAKFGEYTGAVVRLPHPFPDGEHKGKTDVVVLTSAKTRAGKFLMRNLDAGRYDALDGEGTTEADRLPVTVRAKRSKPTDENPEPHPSIVLRHPTGNEAEQED